MKTPLKLDKKVYADILFYIPYFTEGVCEKLARSLVEFKFPLTNGIPLTQKRGMVEIYTARNFL